MRLKSIYIIQIRHYIGFYRFQYKKIQEGTLK